MLKSILAASAVTLALACAPVSAQTKTMMDCSDANITSANGSIEKMGAGEKKTVAMREMGMARDMMAKKDMAACKTHLNNAMGGDTISHDGMDGKK